MQEYTVARDEWVLAKNDRKRLEQALKQLKAEVQPLRDKHKGKEEEVNSSKQLQQVVCGLGRRKGTALSSCSR